MKMLRYMVLCAVLLVLSCNSKTLPILGETSIDENGEILYYTTPEFEMVSQNNSGIHSDAFKGKIQVVDFFFTSCPTICPQMTTHLKLVEEAFRQEDKVQILSFSIDPKNDTPERLENYANQYNINTPNWTFLTHENSSIFEIAKDYKVRAFDDGTTESPSLLHDGTFVLVDENSRIRGYYNGLDKKDTQRLITDIKLLLKNG